ncbi:2Fe-2S iron-sulfur cluster-binding protein [Sedimenticola selenatireducens]|uniref:NADH-quinone oxidoreductase subunit G n=1 Tax=Sedimenticola selenatireducens TaxID=191960 RepID=A0A558DXE3_9GAMM|nr:2Fe-2S iron-sulfur cluster-binding protein [Sedimenticola selenatireducens]TVO70760.1 2Fe-2S iron-sulfur cluster binding domain-containing protein [Sedimenticola selenatireducens]TVT65680.1 MAG: 2Fe-2S iron-sulfur cluster binding domain-containing protein [Sedimenticola selenatireducens]
MTNSFEIDGITVPFSNGQTIMDAALTAGIYIPHLCHNPEFKPHGSCRLCTVLINGRSVAACTTPAGEGIVVENETHELVTQRRLLLKLLFVEGNHTCPGCEKSGACQLQAVAYHCGMLAPEFVHFYPKRSIDASHPDTIIDFNRCILCELCVRASRDSDKKAVFNISGRGIQAHLTIDSPSGKLADSAFNSSDKAARVCPVGAILPKHKGYNIPIGQRLYDQAPISQVGDVAKHQEVADE